MIVGGCWEREEFRRATMNNYELQLAPLPLSALTQTNELGGKKNEDL